MVHLDMDGKDQKVFRVLLVYQEQLDQQAPLASQEILDPMGGQDRKVKGGILAGLEPEFFQVALDLLDREVNRVKGALMATQVPQGIQDQMVIKVYGETLEIQE